MLAATAVLGATTAFANNPFSDVSTDSWAYQAVSQLAEEGIVNGYPDGTFKGQNNITRYKMAQMIAKAMANQDRANAEQQAMINRLADEFSNELNNLGVRVARLEDRVGNIKVTGDVRLRYLGSQEKDGKFVNDGTNMRGLDYSKGSQFDVRARLQFNAKVNDRTDVVIRTTTGNMELGDSSHTSSSGSSLRDKPTNIHFDRAYVNHKFGERVSVKAGRFNQMIGNGLIYDDGFDGVQFNAGNHKLNFQAAYGYGIEGGFATDVYGQNSIDKNGNFTMVYTGLKGQLNDHVNLGGFYTRVNKRVNGEAKNMYGFSSDLNFDKVWVGGEWVKAASVSNGTAWSAGLGYGDYKIAKRGTWDVKAQYFNFGDNIALQSSRWEVPFDATNRYYDPNFHGGPAYVTSYRGYRGWLATAHYALQDNVGVTGYYGFNNKTNKSIGDNDKLPNYYRVDLNYQF